MIPPPRVYSSRASQSGLITRTAEAVDLGEEDLKKLKGLLNRLDKIATQRNLVAHTIFGLMTCPLPDPAI